MNAKRYSLEIAQKHHALGQFDHAKSFYECHLKAHPHDATAKGWFAALLAQLGERSRALVLIDQALEVHPNSADFLATKANLLLHKNQYALALNLYRLGLQFDPLNLAMLVGKCSCELGLNDPKSAIQTSETALTIDSKMPQVWLNYGRALFAAGRKEPAFEALDKALKLQPISWAARSTLADFYQQNGQIERSFDTLMDGVKLSPQNLNLKKAIAERIRKLGRPLQAIQILQDPRSAIDSGALTIEGAAWKDLGDLEKARACYMDALSIDPNGSDALRSLALLDLTELRLKTGWLLLKRSHQRPIKSGAASPINWTGNDSNEPNLILAEQGIGDQVLFSTLIPEARARTPDLTVQCDRRLLRLFAESYPNVKFVDRTLNLPATSFKSVIRSSDVGGLFRTSIEDFKVQGVQSLNPREPSNLAKTDCKVRLAVAWKSTGAAYSSLKSLKIETFDCLANHPAVEAYSVQYGDTADEISEFNRRHCREVLKQTPFDSTNDLYQLATFLQTCDLVITTSNSVAHLSGATGTPTIVLCPKDGGRLWYWEHHENGKHLWYPSVQVKIVTHSTAGETIEGVLRALLKIPSKFSNVLHVK